MCPYLLMSMLMGMAVYAAGLLPLPNYWSMMSVQLAAGIVVYIVLCRAFRLKAFIEIWEWGFASPRHLFQQGS